MTAKNKRSCGDCTACCKALPVYEINKPEGELCSECEEKIGCSIYSTRPKACREFTCQWLMGHGEDSERPDCIGLIPDCKEIEGLGKVFLLWELSEGMLDSSLGQGIISYILQNKIPVLHIYCSGGHKIYVPQTLDIPEKELQLYAGENCKVFIVSTSPP